MGRGKIYNSQVFWVSGSDFKIYFVIDDMPKHCVSTCISSLLHDATRFDF